MLGAIVLGCAAYEAGNILGAVVGAARISGISRIVLTLVIGGGAAILLWLGSPATVARSLSVLVATMGVAFLVTAVGLRPPIGELLRGGLVPAIPAGSTLLVVGLVGTTVVPYNLFLGSGLARRQGLAEIRFGLTAAVLFGGLISIGVLVVGSAVDGAFSFGAVAAVLHGCLGRWAELLLGVGLFAAGFSSAVTAPLAAAVTARGLFGGERWEPSSWRFRAVWIGVLAVGVGCGVADLRPIPAIIGAQVLNGILLPLVAAFLLVAANDRSLLGEDGLSGPTHTALMAVVVLVTVLLGVSSILRAVAGALGGGPPAERLVLGTAAAVAVVLVVPVLRAALRGRRAGGVS